MVSSKNLALAAVAYFSLGAQAQAQDQQSKNDQAAQALDAEIAPRKFSALLNMMYILIDTTYSRNAISGFIRNYGCHCFQDGSKSVGGKGAPVDPMDTACRKLAQCKTCIQMDFPGVCDPHGDAYNYEFDEAAKSITCTDTVGGCYWQACECDKAFAENMAAVWNDSTYNTFFWHNRVNIKQGNAVFDKENTCVINTTGVDNDKCCGAYPERRPYSDFNYECCSDGSVRTIGNCN